MSQALPPTAVPPPPPNPYLARHRPQRARFAAAVLTGALVVGGGAGLGGAAAWSAFHDDAGTTTNSSSSASSFPVVDSPAAPATDGSVESVAAAVLPSVVKLDVSGGSNAGSGSGVVLDKDGLILTNDHVVTLAGSVPADQATVTASFNDGSKVKATVLGTDPLTDTALIKVDDVANLKPITIGKSNKLEVGQQVVAIGSPYGLDATVTSGIVSALDRPVDVGQDSQGNTTAYPAIQTDAAINPGNSGGALVDLNGHLVGINASIQTASSSMGSEGGSIGLGFAIPIDEVLPIVQQMKDGETPTHARLGIEISNVAATGPQGAQVADGAQIQKISAGSAAGDAGLRTGDVITAIDGRPVTGADSLIARIRAYRPGDEVKVSYLRNGAEQSTELKLGSDASTTTS